MLFLLYTLVPAPVPRILCKECSGADNRPAENWRPGQPQHPPSATGTPGWHWPEPGCVYTYVHCTLRGVRTLEWHFLSLSRRSHPLMGGARVCDVCGEGRGPRARRVHPEFQQKESWDISGKRKILVYHDLSLDLKWIETRSVFYWKIAVLGAFSTDMKKKSRMMASVIITAVLLYAPAGIGELTCLAFVM